MLSGCLIDMTSGIRPTCTGILMLQLKLCDSEQVGCLLQRLIYKSVITGRRLPTVRRWLSTGLLWSRRTDSFCYNDLSQVGSKANSLGRWSVFLPLICKGQVHSLLFVIGIMSPSGAGGRSFTTDHKRLGAPRRGIDPLGHKPRMCCITRVGLGGQGGQR